MSKLYNSNNNQRYNEIQVETELEDFTVLSKNPCYSDNITKMVLDPIPNDLSILNSISDGVLTINFTPDVEKRSVYNTWSFWGNPPCVESSIPPWVLFSSFSDSLELQLSQGVNVFGFELSPNLFYYHYDVKVEYYNGSNLLGTVTRNISAVYPEGARVFEVCSKTQLIDNIKISITPTDGAPNGYGFAIGQIYYGTDNSSCCGDCGTRDIPFEFDINLDTDFGYYYTGDIKPQFIGYSIIELTTEIVTGYKKEVNVKVCNDYLTCCMPFDAMHIAGRAKLLIEIPDILTYIGCPGKYTCICTNHIHEIEFDEVCFTCVGATPDINYCDLLTFMGATVEIVDYYTLRVKGTMKFNCPYSGCVCQE